VGAVTAEFQIEFLGYLQRLLDEGGFTATYKFALLMALADLAVELGDDEGGPLEITSEQIARKFILYYSRQARPFVPADPQAGASILHQNTGKQAAVVSVVAEAQSEYSWHDGQTPNLLLKDASLVSRVAGIVRVMPLWKLQTLGGQVVDFLYPNAGTGHAITLRPGVAFCFRRFHGIVYRLAQDGWIRLIRERKQNAALLGEKIDLGAFLFGSGRADLSPYRPLLIELQKRRCFYCARDLKTSEVDHFIPWARYSIDLGHNFVLACKGCNSSKGDLLAGLEFLEAWKRRNEDCAVTMREYFLNHSLPHDLPGTLGIADWAYSTTWSSQGVVWIGGKNAIPIHLAGFKGS